MKNKEPNNAHERAESKPFERMEKRTKTEPEYTKSPKKAGAGKKNYKGKNF